MQNRIATLNRIIHVLRQAGHKPSEYVRGEWQMSMRTGHFKRTCGSHTAGFWYNKMPNGEIRLHYREDKTDPYPQARPGEIISSYERLLSDAGFDVERVQGSGAPYLAIKRGG